MYTNVLAKTARRFINGMKCIGKPFFPGRKVEDITGKISCLPGVEVCQGYSIECLLPSAEGLGGTSILIARDREVRQISPSDLKMDFGRRRETELPEGYLYAMDALLFENTEYGIWSAFLVRECWRFLPLWWHANYAKQKWVLDADALLKVLGIKETQLDALKEKSEAELKERRQYGFHSDSELLKVPSMVGDESLLPTVCRTGESSWELKYVYFSPWGGLI